MIESNGSKGGRDYQLFRETVRRLSRVIYENTGFYDPIRGEHRDVAFGFLKYSLPIGPDSSRTWRFVWDQQFFEFCQATGGGLWFDLDTYRRLDFASRRLFVLLQKIFYRSMVSPTFDVGRLCVDVLGFSPTVDMRNLKIKLARCIDRLATEGVVRLPTEATRPQELFVKQGVGKYRLAFTRGPYFERKRGRPAPLSAEESPLVDPLRSIGFDDAAMAWLLWLGNCGNPDECGSTCPEIKARRQRMRPFFPVTGDIAPPVLASVAFLLPIGPTGRVAQPGRDWRRRGRCEATRAGAGWPRPQIGSSPADISHCLCQSIPAAIGRNLVSTVSPPGP